jgi:alkylation response protein AidB-like acyl-CoA dehydrogenase
MKPEIRKIFAGHFSDDRGNYCNKIEAKTIEAIFDQGLFKCFLPENYGGLGLSLIETLDVIEACAYENGSLGWLIQIGNGGMYFASNFDQGTSLDLFSPKNAVIAGSGAPSGFGKKTENGYLVTGTWNYCSGSDHATLFTVTFNDQETGETFAAIMSRDDVQRIKTWNSIGLRHTSTDTIRLETVFIPAGHVFNVSEQKGLTEVAIFRVPFTFFAQAFFLHTAFGIYERLLSESTNHLDRKSAHWSTHFPKRLNRAMHVIQQGHDLLNTHRSLIRAVVEENVRNEKVEDHQSADLIQIAKNLRNSAHEIYSMLGIEVLDRDHVIAICYQDILATTQHYLLVDH